MRTLVEKGYDLHLIYLWLRSPEIAIARVQERVRAGGHNIPEETIRRRYKRGVENFFNIYQEVVSTWSVFDHSSLNQATVIATGQGKNNNVVCDEAMWTSVCEAAK